MTVKDKELRKYKDRVIQREKRHPNWRQVYVDCLGMCQFPIDGVLVCEELDTLEFHEIYGEAKNGETKLQKRVLLCNYHHWSIHGGKWVNKRHYSSMLQYDVALEIMVCGSYQSWLEKYKLIDRRVNYDIAWNTGEDTTDFNYSEDS